MIVTILSYLVTIGSRIIYNDVMSLNYSLVTNITCKGGEDSVAQCTVYKPTNGCKHCHGYTIGLQCLGICQLKMCVD